MSDHTSGNVIGGSMTDSHVNSERENSMVSRNNSSMSGEAHGISTQPP